MGIRYFAMAGGRAGLGSNGRRRAAVRPTDLTAGLPPADRRLTAT